MTKEDKELLLKDLSVRLPYGVKILYEGNVKEIQYIEPLYNELKLLGNDSNYTIGIEECKPYLRPMSSMTEEEFVEYYNIKYNNVTYRDKWKRIDVGKYHNVGIIPIDEYLDWLNAHYFDYRGLIEKDLAIEAPKDMYK